MFELRELNTFSRSLCRMCGKITQVGLYMFRMCVAGTLLKIEIPLALCESCKKELKRIFEKLNGVMKE